MTNHEAYLFGCSYGYIMDRVKQKTKRSSIGYPMAEVHPFSALGYALKLAHSYKALNEDDHEFIQETLNGIDCIEADIVSGNEKAQPSDICGSWYLGFYKGKQEASVDSEKK